MENVLADGITRWEADYIRTRLIALLRGEEEERSDHGADADRGKFRPRAVDGIAIAAEAL